MRRTRLTFPPSLRERIEGAQTGMDFYAASADAARIPLGPPLPPKRSRKAKTDTRENPVRNACLEFMALHPRVAWVGRFNRGTIVVEDRQRRKHYYQMNTVEGFSDIHGMTKDGKPIYCETKADGKQPTDAQEKFLTTAKKYGAIAFVAWSIDDCKAALEE